MLRIILLLKWWTLKDELTSIMVLGEYQQWTKWTSNYAASRNLSKQRHLFTSNNNHSPSLQTSYQLKRSFNKILLMQSTCCNSHLELAATPQRQPNDRLELQHIRWNQITFDEINYQKLHQKNSIEQQFRSGVNLIMPRRKEELQKSKIQ